MTKARSLADFVSAGNPLSDGRIDIDDVTGLTGAAEKLALLDGVTENVGLALGRRAAKVDVVGATVGSSSAIPVVTFNSDGLITGATEVSVASVSGATFNAENGVLNIATSDGNSLNVTLSSINADLLDGQHGAYYLDANNFINMPDPAVYDVSTSSTGFFDLPSGTTAQRPASPSTGNIRVNSEASVLEVYTPTGWKQLALPPVPEGISGAINQDTDTTITITGREFSEGCVVKISGAGANNSIRELPTTFVSSTQLTATTGASASNYAAGQLFDVIVQAASGLTGTLPNAGSIDSDPVWVTANNAQFTLDDRGPNANIQLSATDPDGDTVSFSLASGSLPTGLSLSSTGLISGDQADVSGSTTYPFTVNASSTNNGFTTSIPRSFSIVVNRLIDGSTTDRAFSDAAQAAGFTGVGYIQSKTGGIVQTQFDDGWVQVVGRTSVGGYGWNTFGNTSNNVEYSADNNNYQSRLRHDFDFNYIRIKTQSHDTYYYNATTRDNLTAVRGVTYMKAGGTGSIPGTTWDNKGTYYDDRIWVGYYDSHRSYLLSPYQNNGMNAGGYFIFSSGYGGYDDLASSMSPYPQYFKLWLK